MINKKPKILAAVFQAAGILGFEVFFGMEGSMTDWKSIMQQKELPKRDLLIASICFELKINYETKIKVNFPQNSQLLETAVIGRFLLVLMLVHAYPLTFNSNSSFF